MDAKRYVGVIGYCNNSGLGQMIRALREQGIVQSQFVIPHDIKGTDLDILKNFPYTVAKEKNTTEMFAYMARKLNAIIFIETPFNFDYFEQVHAAGIKTILIPMIDSIEMERFVPYCKYIDLVIHPTKIGYEIYKQKGWKGKFIHLPWPINTDEFNPEKLPIQPFTFLHNEGFGGSGYRKGTDAVFVAFRQLQMLLKDISLHVRSQCKEPEYSQIKNEIENVTIAHDDSEGAICGYFGGKIYLAPSRREGLGLPILEAMACGLPVITTDAAPMNEWGIDSRLLVPVKEINNLSFGDTEMTSPSVLDLMYKMEFAVKNFNLMEKIGKQNCNIIRTQFSWNVLRRKWIEAIDG